MLWPTQIRLISLPSVFFLTLFWGMGLLTLAMAFRLQVQVKRAGFFWIGFTALAMGMYSLVTMLLYSAPSLHAISFWQRMQLVSSVLVFIFIVFFSDSYLRLRSTYWTSWVPLITLIFLPLLAVRDWSLAPVLSPKTFPFAGYSTRIFEYELGPVALVALAWFFLNILLLGTRWWRFFRSHPRQWPIPLSFAIFQASGINDALVATGVYQSFYLLEVGFLGFVFAMGYQVVREYIGAAQALAFKSQEVEGLNEEMQFLISSISHDLNGPLLSIQGFLENFESLQLQDPKRHEYLQRVRHNTEHMQGMLGALVEFMRAGRVEVATAPVKLEKIAAEVSWLLEGEGLPVPDRLEMPEAWPNIISCERSIKQILINLLHNAFKHAAVSQGQVRVAWEDQENGLMISVSDEGPGVPKELREKVFEPFFRFDPRTPGTGMGLAIAKKLSESLEGRIWLDTNYREGARFCVFLPKGR